MISCCPLSETDDIDQFRKAGISVAVLGKDSDEARECCPVDSKMAQVQNCGASEDDLLEGPTPTEPRSSCYPFEGLLQLEARI